MVDHIVSLAAAFDTASAFAISFGINKFQLAQAWVKLVGGIVGREGRKSNPELVRAIKKWPPIEHLKMLQEFLGTVTRYRLVEIIYCICCAVMLTCSSCCSITKSTD